MTAAVLAAAPAESRPPVKTTALPLLFVRNPPVRSVNVSVSELSVMVAVAVAPVLRTAQELIVLPVIAPVLALVDTLSAATPVKIVLVAYAGKFVLPMAPTPNEPAVIVER